VAKKTIVALHDDWVQLIQKDGPFLTLPVLCDKLRGGLASFDGPRVRRQLRDHYDEWKNKELGYEEWVKYVLSEFLGYTDEFLSVFNENNPIPKELRHKVREYGEVLEPKMLLHSSAEDGSGPEMLIMILKEDRSGKSLQKRLPGSRWAASPISRMTDLLRATNIQIGLVTDGEQWALVDVPTSGDDRIAGAASWSAQMWFDEDLHLRSFWDLLGSKRFFALDENEKIQALLADSRKSQHDITDQLGLQLRRSVEIFVRALDGADKDANGTLLAGVSEKDLYEATTTVMMRLIVLLCAEERAILPAGDPLFDSFYAVGTIGEQLRAKAQAVGDEVLERAYDAWPRLLAAFRAMYSGVDHDRLKMRPYGGGLFDPDRFPFLEGRQPGTTWEVEKATPIKIHNRTVLHILDSIQFINTRIAGHTEKRKLSFESLGVEQVGHVYEGLLDHTASRADDVVLGLIGKKPGEEPEVELSDLEGWLQKSEKELFGKLKDLDCGSPGKIKKLFEGDVESQQLEKIHAVLGEDDEAWERIKPFAGLIRNDDLGEPLVMKSGSLYVTAGMDRREGGAHYTPRSLSEPIVKTTLEVQVYNRPSDKASKDDAVIKTPEEILDLKVCDPACGSGAFLVGSVRYLAERLVESWDKAEQASGSPIDRSGKPTTASTESDRLPADPEERLHLAQRLVAGSCIYGVDKNPLAVEMAKVSVWLLLLAKDEPFGFLDHAIKCGDSLVGLTRKQIAQMTWEEPASVKGTIFELIDEAATDASIKRLEIESLGAGHESDKQLLHVEAEEALANVKLVGDVVVASFFNDTTKTKRKQLLSKYAGKISDWLDKGLGKAGLEKIAAELRQSDRPVPPFHWEIEFPEVFARENGGFDAFVGNPPFAGKNNLIGGSRKGYLDWLKSLHVETHGNSDLVAHFFRRAFTLLRQSGTTGLIATKTIRQGDTRSTGLRWIRRNQGIIYFANRRQSWPGAASVVISIVHIFKGPGPLNVAILLDGRPVETITAYLFHAGTDEDAAKLNANEQLCFCANVVLGVGFTFDDDDRSGQANSIAKMRDLLAEDPRNQELIFPYINGKEVNGAIKPLPTRYIINFGDMPFKDAQAWPSLLAIAEQKVKPQRYAGQSTVNPERWWMFARPATELYSTIRDYERVLVRSLTSTNFSTFTFLPTGYVYDQTLIVFAYQSPVALAILAGRIHEAWGLFQGGSMKDDPRYNVDDCFKTFPFPTVGMDDRQLLALGQSYFDCRAQYQESEEIGLTKTYNHFHDPHRQSEGILELRRLHGLMDAAVLRAYGWDDLADRAADPEFCKFILDYEVEEDSSAAKPYRYRWPDEFRDEVLARLLELNEQRYKEEVAAGLHGASAAPKAAKKPKKKRSSKKSKPKSKTVALPFAEDSE